MPVYNLVKCSNCGLFQVTSASKSLKCQRCGKNKSLPLLKKFYTTTDAKEASIALQKMKENEAIEKGKFTNEFGTYKINK